MDTPAWMASRGSDEDDETWEDIPEPRHSSPRRRQRVAWSQWILDAADWDDLRDQADEKSDERREPCRM